MKYLPSTTMWIKSTGAPQKDKSELGDGKNQEWCGTKPEEIEKLKHSNQSHKLVRNLNSNPLS